MAGVCSPSRWEPKSSCHPGVLCEASLVWDSDEGPTSISPKAVATCAHHTPGPAHLPGFHCPEGHCLNHHSSYHHASTHPTVQKPSTFPDLSRALTLRLTSDRCFRRGRGCTEGGGGDRSWDLFLWLWSDVGHGSDRRTTGNEIPGPGSVLRLGAALLGPRVRALASWASAVHKDRLSFPS